MDITVIIPTYNRAWALPKAIASCMQPNGPDVQIIVVDDGSTDGTHKILAQQNNIEIYKQEHWGKPFAVNLAFTHAKGKYIKFLDSDDWLETGSLLKEFTLAESTGADIVVAGYNLYDNDTYVSTQPWTHCDDFIAQNLGECDSSHYSAFLFKREFIADIPHRTSFSAANFASRDDRCFMLEVALKHPKIAVLDGATLCHRTHTKGRLQFQTDLAAACTNYQHLLIYKNILKQLSDAGTLTQRRIQAAVNILWPLCTWISKNSINEGVQTYNWILELQPDFKVPEKGLLGWLYKNAGFKSTQRLLNLRRNTINAFR
jgi:glycosyltransferase involved in cell wall biosynthesis